VQKCVCVCVCVWPVYSMLLDVVTNDNTPRCGDSWVNGGIIPHILDLGVDFHLHCQTAVLHYKDPSVAILVESVWAPKAVWKPPEIIRTAVKERIRPTAELSLSRVLDHGSHCSVQGLWKQSCCVYCYLNHTCSNTALVYFRLVCCRYMFRSYCIFLYDVFVLKCLWMT
jgi:hypothetical protein